MNTKDAAKPAEVVDVEALKEKYGDIYKIIVADEVIKHDPYMVPTADDEEIQNGVVAYIRKPSSKEINFAMSKMPQMIEAGKVILKTCFVGGDRRVTDDPSMFTAGALQCIELLEIRQAQLKKALEEDYPEIEDDSNGFNFRVMSSWIRYFFPSIEPYDLETDDLARIWREAQYLLEKTKPQKAES